MKQLVIPLALALSCTGARPPPHLLGEAPPPAHPTSDFIAAIGRSETSPEDAAERARAEVARKISSRLTAVFERIEQETATDGRIASNHRTLSSIRSETEFKHAHLIEIVERHSGRDAHYSLAVLSRAAAGRQLAADYRALASEFRAAVEQALLGEQNPRAFTAAHRRAVNSFRTLAPLGMQLAAIDPSNEAEVVGDMRLLRELRTARERVVQKVVLGMPAGVAEAEALRAALASTATALGLRVASDAATQVVVQVRESWPRGLGVCCRWDSSMLIDGTPVPLDLELMGCHPKNRELARRELVSQLDERLLGTALKSALSMLVPWEE